MFLKRLIFLIIIPAFSYAQSDTLKINRKQAEQFFLENNFELILKKLEIDKSEATIIQAQVWPNPNLSIEQINLWGSGDNSDSMPPIIGNWGKNTQFSVALSQQIQTAGKRRKLIEIEKVQKENAGLYFEELLKSLKQDFIQKWTELQFLQNREGIYNILLTELDELVSAFEIQFLEKNINKSEIIRLQSLKMEFDKDVTDIQKQKNEIIAWLNVFLSLPNTNYIIATETDFKIDLELIRGLDPNTLQKIALKNRIELKSAQKEIERNEKEINYQKALSIPDLNLSVEYDRGGGIWRNFVGLGISMDLPFFDRNKGNIQFAKIEEKQSKIAFEQKKNEIKSEVLNTFSNLQALLKNQQKIDKNFEQNLDDLLPSYRTVYLNRNISLLEYIDFLESYINSKTYMAELSFEINQTIEELQYQIGIELNSL